MNRIGAILFFTVLLLSAQAKGQIAVYDASNFSQMASQLRQAAEAYQRQLEELQESIKQTQALTGTRDVGDLLNSPLEAELRRYLPEELKDLTETLEYQDLYALYEPLSKEAYTPLNPNSPIALAREHNTKSTLSTMSTVETTYSSLSKRIETYEALLEELNQTEDLKKSVDLQARISVENGLVLNELMRINTLLIGQQAARDNEFLADQNRAARLNRYDASRAREAFQLKEKEE